MLLQKFVHHYLKEIGYYCQVLTPIVEQVVNIGRACPRLDQDLKEKYGPSVDAPLGLQLPARESIRLHGKTVIVKARLFNHAKTGVVEHAVDLFVENIRVVVV